MKKVEVSEEKRTEVVDYLCRQIDIALEDRATLEKRWIKWIKQYEEILPEKKAFPWQGCSNMSIPLSPITVETIHAREVNTIFSIKPYIQIKPKKKDVNKEYCQKLERFLDQIFTRVLKLYETGSAWFMEKNKMGTGYLKVYWNFDVKKTPRGMNIIDDAAASIVPIEDLIFPTNATDIQTCEWLAHRIRTQWNNLKRKEKLNIYQDVDKIKNFKYEPNSSLLGQDVQAKKEETQDLQRTSPQSLDEYQIFEIYFDYDIDDDGYNEQTVLTLHKESRTILRWIEHPYNHGKRPFIDNRYINRAGSVYGKGILEISEFLQDGVNTVFNQTIDNATIANIKCFKGRKTAKEDIGTVFPGKTFWLDDPSDLEEFMLGEVHQSNFMIHNLLRDYHERRTKVSDYVLGRESSVAGGRATATGTLALLQESGRHFDLIINNTRNALVELAYQVIELYMQYKPQKVFMVDGEDDTLIELSASLESVGNLREEYEFYCAATSLAVNKEIEKQSNLLMIQQLGMIYQQMLQLMMTVSSPMTQLPPIVVDFILKIIQSYYNMAEDLLRSFEKIDISAYLPDISGIMQNNQNTKEVDYFHQLGGAIAQIRNKTMGAGANEPSGMEGMPAGTGEPAAEGNLGSFGEDASGGG